MKDNRRRNRNIGTAKQGYGKNNKLTIPSPALISKTFFERLDKYKKVEESIKGHDFLFVIEQTRKNSEHPCSIADIKTIIENIPTKDYGDLKLIILRQPKRKEEIIMPVWGRLIYSYEFEKEYYPAIILEAVDYTGTLKWPRKLSVDCRKELERLQKDGHNFIEDKRYFTAPFELKNVRKTQLYRTLIHEFGHYVHYLDVVERPGKEDEDFEEWKKRHELYFKIPAAEKEKFAHKYAEILRGELISKKIIPFEKK